MLFFEPLNEFMEFLAGKVACELAFLRFKRIEDVKLPPRTLRALPLFFRHGGTLPLVPVLSLVWFEISARHFPVNI